MSLQAKDADCGRESGAGKTMIGKTIFDILPRAARLWQGRRAWTVPSLADDARWGAAETIARTSVIIPQDPLTAFNPVRRIDGRTDRLTAILGLSWREARTRSLKLLEEVHISDRSGDREATRTSFRAVCGVCADRRYFRFGA